MSPVQACTGCGGLFAYLPRGLCGECIDLREQRYQTVRDWLIDNRGASIARASEATGIEEGLIGSFIREGRLEFVADGMADAQELRDREALRARIASEMAARTGSPGGTSAPRSADRASGMKSRLL